MKKKVGIVTLNGNFNYGNRLQNYAMERVIESLGYEAHTVIVPRVNVGFSLYVQIKKFLKKILKRKQTENSWTRMVQAKEQFFLPFTEQHLNNTELYITINEDFDFFVVGSDQVWNPNIIGENPNFFLQFADRTKRISYAASFGVSEIPKENESFYIELLSNMNYISVREESGKNIVRSLIDKDAKVVVDPTMLLSAENWNNLIEQNIDIKESNREKYIMLYFLKGVSEENYKKILEYAETNSLEVIEIMGDEFDEKYKIFNPVEFIEKIKNAHMVFSDSFHCGVFSIIFHTPFVIYDRMGDNMESRIETLLKTFNLIKNKYSPSMNFNEVLETEFSNVDNILEEKKMESLSFLKNALQGEK